MLIALVFLFTWKLYPTENPAVGLLKESRFSSLNTVLTDGVHNFYRNPVNPKDFGRSLESIAEPDIQLKKVSFDCPAVYQLPLPHQQLSERVLSALPPPFVRTRPTVPLFVLYHSWKSFLC